ncbi:ABC-2 transporter permease [Clostridium cochlearium]|uniref:ABC-2 transporter permease n=1 Tax=Clostridium cochlearium TaxID=1494 RepID=UPI00241D81B1|nr:ABC-2 transporter permease [Clostridium cochlearium]MBE6066058.1 ABC-2 transporter permease [Clostridium cochlearium]
MRSVYNLIKKDFLLIKKIIFPIIVFNIGAPIYISSSTPTFQESGGILYAMLVYMITFMIYHAISLEEMKYKGNVYLKVTPMPMVKIVISKYIIIALTFLTTTVLYLITSKFPISHMGSVSIKSMTFMFTVICLYFGFYIPLTFKLGHVKLQVISTALIFIFPFALPYLMKYLGSNYTLIAYYINSSTLKITMISLCIVMISITSGVFISNSILRNKEY